MYSNQKKSWLTGIKDGRSSSPTVQFENIGIGLYTRLKKKEKIILHKRKWRNRRLWIVRMAFFNKKFTPASWYFIYIFLFNLHHIQRLFRHIFRISVSINKALWIQLICFWLLTFLELQNDRAYVRTYSTFYCKLLYMFIEGYKNRLDHNSYNYLWLGVVCMFIYIHISDMVLKTRYDFWNIQTWGPVYTLGYCKVWRSQR